MRPVGEGEASLGGRIHDTLVPAAFPMADGATGAARRPLLSTPGLLVLHRGTGDCVADSLNPDLGLRA